MRDFAPDSFWKCEEIGGIAGTARGMNRTHKRTLAGAKLRHIESLQCRKNFVYSLKKQALGFIDFFLFFNL